MFIDITFTTFIISKNYSSSSLYMICVYYSRKQWRKFRSDWFTNKKYFDINRRDVRSNRITKIAWNQTTCQRQRKFTLETLIKFNDDYIKQNNKNIHLSQERQCKNIKLVILKTLTDLISARDIVKKVVISKNQYVAQRARSAYVAIVCQFKTTLNLFFAVQMINSWKKNVKTLKKRFAWQMKNLNRDLQFIQLNISILKIIIFIDNFFANNYDLFSQIDYVIILTNASNRENIIHWSFTKCKWIIRSALAFELYAMTHDFDAAAVIKSIVEKILHILLLSLIACINSKFLYDCLIRLDSTQKIRFVIDVMCFRQFYKRREIMKVR